MAIEGCSRVVRFANNAREIDRFIGKLSDVAEPRIVVENAKYVVAVLVVVQMLIEELGKDVRKPQLLIV